MMPKVHILDVPEFAGIVDCARGRADLTVTAARRGYITIAGEGEIAFDRRACGFKPAIWYSCLCGGIEGRIAEFGRDTLRIVETAG